MDSDTQAQIDAFKAEMKRRSELVHTNLGKSMANVCQLVENTAKLGMTNTQTDPSKAYPRGNKMHYASADGEYPAVDTGMLRRSVTHNIEQDGTTVTGEVGSQLVYGAYLEHGTSKMAPRPWLAPSVEKNRAKIYELLKSSLEDREVSIEYGSSD